MARPGLPSVTWGFLLPNGPRSWRCGLSQCRQRWKRLSFLASVRQSLAERGYMNTSSCVECLWSNGLCVQNGCLVTRVPSSAGVGRQGSEVMSPRFQDGGPFPPSDPPKAPSGLLTAHPPCPCHLPSCTESSITALRTAPWDRKQRPSFEERAPSSDLLFPSSSVSWKSHCASQGLPSLPTCTMGWR